MPVAPAAPASPSEDDEYEDDEPSHPARHVHVVALNRAHRVSWLVWVGVVLFVSLSGVGFGFVRWKHNAIGSALVWDGKEPFHCSGNDKVSLSGVEASFSSGSAIVATGNCQLRCTDCTITAPTTLEANGNAQIEIVNGRILGSAVLAEASGNARVTISGNVVAKGRVVQAGNAKVSAPASQPTAATHAAPPTFVTATASAPSATPSAAPANGVKKKVPSPKVPIAK